MFAYKHHKLNREVGLALIELMIGAVLSLLLLSILTSIYLTCEKSYRLQESLNHIESNAKTAAHILRAEIRKAGHIGCAHLTSDFPLMSFPPYTITSQNKLMGTSSAIAVRYADLPNVSLIKPIDARDELYTTNNISFASGNVLIISDCHHAEIVKIKKVFHFRNGQKLITTHPIHTKFSPGAEVSRLVINKYFIAKTNYKDANEDAGYSLFMENIFHRKRELVSGISKMQLLFSVIENGMMIDFPAHEIMDWSSVVGVAIKLAVTHHQLKKNWYLYSAVNK